MIICNQITVSECGTNKLVRTRFISLPVKTFSSVHSFHFVRITNYVFPRHILHVKELSTPAPYEMHILHEHDTCSYERNTFTVILAQLLKYDAYSLVTKSAVLFESYQRQLELHNTISTLCSDVINTLYREIYLNYGDFY